MRCARTDSLTRELEFFGFDVIMVADTYNFGGKKMMMWMNRNSYTMTISDQYVSCVTVTGPIAPR